MKQAERDAGTRSDGLTTAERDELAQLRRENRRLREDVDILKRETAFVVKAILSGARRGSLVLCCLAHGVDGLPSMCGRAGLPGPVGTVA
ncbi:hypothetical protein E0H73_45520 [Kribbella pittospori]|uniref:Transposase n=1 Tax=Kribbella pittospori TaxID=722689 RepID=A0A4R0JCI4_9ACTN|nr:hypothetical protein [Kribbella pittospori]TCC44401.1 hypothetical protein E0H73_45520 [Kribbella pittospori]